MAVSVVLTIRDLDEGAHLYQRYNSSAIWDRTPEAGKQRLRDKMVRLCQATGIDIVVEDKDND